MNSKKCSIISIICGVLGIVGPFIVSNISANMFANSAVSSGKASGGVLGLILSIILLAAAIAGIVFGAQGISKAKAEGVGSGLATAGLVISIFGVVFSIVGVLCMVVCASAQTQANNAIDAGLNNSDVSDALNELSSLLN